MSAQLLIQTVDRRTLSPKLLAAKHILPHAYEDMKGEMFFVHNDNFEIEDVEELALEDWKLPPSIEDGDAILGDKPIGTILEEARGTRSEAILFILL